MALQDPLGQKIQQINCCRQYTQSEPIHTSQKRERYEYWQSQFIINNSPELGFCFGKIVFNGKIYLIQIISAVYSNRHSSQYFPFYLHSQMSVMILKAQSH